MNISNQVVGNQHRSSPSLIKRRRGSENSINSTRLVQLQAIKSVSPQSNRPIMTTGSQMSGVQMNPSAAIATVSHHDSAPSDYEFDSDNSSTTHGLRKKARCSSICNQSLKEPVESVENSTLVSTILPDPMAEDVDPDSYLIRLAQAQSGIKLKVRAALDLQGYFPEITEAQVASYNTQVVTACRNNEVETLKRLRNEGHSMECCNRFGESLLHMACRRGFVEVVEFLLQDVGLAVRIRDDCGRTPLHDACWHAQPQLRICELLLERDPELLLIADKRGHTPFQYAREHDWPLWRKMLFDHQEQLQCLDSEETLKHFSLS